MEGVCCVLLVGGIMRSHVCKPLNFVRLDSLIAADGPSLEPLRIVHIFSQRRRLLSAAILIMVPRLYVKLRL